jgi:flagellar hook-length control protein FliK
MEQGPFIQAFVASCRSASGKAETRSLQHAGFEQLMNGRRQYQNLTAGQERKITSDESEGAGEKQAVDDATESPPELPTTPPFDLQLALQHATPFARIETGGRASRQLQDWPPAAAMLRQDASAMRDRNNTRDGPLRQPLESAGTGHSEMAANLIRQLADRKRPNADAGMDADRMSASQHRCASAAGAEAFVIAAEPSLEQPADVPRIRFSRVMEGGQDPWREPPGHQPAVPAMLPVSAASQSPTTQSVNATPAEQISQRLHQVLEDMTNGARDSAASGAVKSIKMVLEPEQLGTVHVTLALDVDGLHIKIAASETATVDLLRRDWRQLDGLLRPAGTDGPAAPVTISITPLAEIANITQGPLLEHHAPPGASSQGFQHPGPRQDRQHGSGRQQEEGRAIATTEKHEDSLPVRPGRPGIVVV